MACRKGLTTWVFQAGRIAVGYRWNMNLRQAVHTFAVVKGSHKLLACGPFLIEW